VKKDLDSGTDILYIYDGWQCIEERNAATPSTVLRQYVYGSQYIDEVVCKIEDPGGTPGKLFYLHDCNYNVVALTNTSGAVQERYNYEPYGGLTIADASYGSRSATAQNNSLTFQGQRYDAESGLYYFRNRYLSPVLGRFLQRDPVVYGDGMNLYEFVGSRPISEQDHLGLGIIREIVIDYCMYLSPLSGLTRAAYYTCAGLLYGRYKDAQPPNGYTARPDTYKHCLLSCKIARTCGSLAGSAEIGLMKEFPVDWIRDRLREGSEVGGSVPPISVPSCGPKSCEMRDLENDAEGLGCALTSMECEECCACPNTPKHD